MSEEKLYVVKNDEGKYWDFEDQDSFWELSIVISPSTAEEEYAKNTADEYGGHVVTFIEETEKVALTKEQAEIVEDARIIDTPATYISERTDEHIGEKILGEEILLIKALTNGYNVAKEKKYNVKVPRTKDTWYYESGEGYLRTICPEDKKLRGMFTEADIEHYGLQDCEKEEVTDDDEED